MSVKAKPYKCGIHSSDFLFTPARHTVPYFPQVPPLGTYETGMAARTGKWSGNPEDLTKINRALSTVYEAH